MQDTYEIKDVNALEESAGNLATYSQNLVNNTNSLSYILETVNNLWQNENGQDKASYVSTLNDCIKEIKETIIPTLNRYVETMNTLAASTRTTQSNTVDNFTTVKGLKIRKVFNKPFRYILKKATKGNTILERYPKFEYPVPKSSRLTFMPMLRNFSKILSECSSLAISIPSVNSNSRYFGG